MSASFAPAQVQTSLKPPVLVRSEVDPNLHRYDVRLAHTIQTLSGTVGSRHAEWRTLAD